LTFAKLPASELDDASVELRERVPQREQADGKPLLEHAERGLAIRARKRAGRRHRRIGAGRGESLDRSCREERHVDGEDDGHVAAGGAQPCDDADDRRSDGRAVVEDREGQRERLVALADGDRLVAGIGQQAPGPLGERLVAEPGEGLRRPEPAARSADEEDPRQASIRHASV
jgi:hypothetical protein